jgi:hypothetical protein
MAEVYARVLRCRIHNARNRLLAEFPSASGWVFLSICHDDINGRNIAVVSYVFGLGNHDD